MSQVKVDSIVDSSGGNNATINTYTPTLSNMPGYNRIINGDMRIDQRNAGAAVTASGSYPVDRFSVFNSTDGAFSSSRSTTAPTGFTNSLYFTTTTADASLAATQFSSALQRIEGFNIADLGWGTANAKTVTLSFWTRSSLTGTFGGSLRNSDTNRSYPFTYTISSANTWEYKTVTIPGDTTGTWLTDNGLGVSVTFGLGVGSTYSGTAGAWAAANYLSATGATSVIGTLNATWYITGVQLEVGSVATPFERRPYGTELALCQRYYIMDTYTVSGGAQRRFISGGLYSTTQWEGVYSFPVEMRAAPTLTTSAVGTFGFAFSGATVSVIAAYTPNTRSSLVYTSNSATGAAGYAGSLSSVATNGVVTFISWSAEL